LAHEGCIAVSHRDIELLDLEALHELQRVTRGRHAGERHPGTGLPVPPVVLDHAAMAKRVTTLQ
jgi:hypothetical protein